MNPLHFEFNPNSGTFVPNHQITGRLTLLAQAVVGEAGAVIDIHQEAYRYSEHFVFRLSVTGLAGKAAIALSSSLQPLEHEQFYLHVVDSVDALTIMEMLRTQLRLQSLPLLSLAGNVSPAGSARAMALIDVIRWHNAQIAYYSSERARLAQWSLDNEGDSPGSFYEECERRIEEHQHFIARIAEITC